jgi:chemotaxis protein histidine kinase CheA/CheY-like chemotaxis protein
LEPHQRKRLESFRGIAEERLTRLNLLWVQLEQGLGEPEAMRDLARELHTLKGESALMGLPQVAAQIHGLEELLRPQFAGAPVDAAVGDQLLRGLDLVGETINAAATEPNKGPSGTTSATTEEAAPQSVPIPRDRAAALRTSDTVRVTSAKLDRVRDIIGELMLTRARLDLSTREFRKAHEMTREYQEQTAPSGAVARLFGMLLEAIAGIETRLREDSYRITDLVAELDGATRELRMVPLGRLFEQYPLAVRELARELGREVRLDLEGEAIEVDRSVLDRLADPLLHLVRNAVDHGIEPPEARRRAGKRPEGRLALIARLAGRMLEVTITDDGAGVDVETVRARAVELGLLDAAQARGLTPEQVLRTLFLARMSTRRDVTKVSGRGIGLDVVLSNVEGLGGTVAVQSTLGVGTSFHLAVPVTLAMTSIVLFEVGTSRYAIPAASVVALVDAGTCPIVASIDGPAIRYAGNLAPLVSLSEVLEEAQVAAHPDRSEQPRLMIVRNGRGLLALSGSSHHSEHEVVLKPTGKFFERNRLLHAAVSLADGTLALVLSVNELLSGSLGGPGAARTATAQKRKTVLVVDDSPVVRDLLAEALRAHGLWVLEASDGEDALSRLDANPEIDLVVTDVDMPRLDGIGLVQRVRQRGGPRRMPMVIVSMRGSPEDQRRALDAGADSYLVKTDLSHAGLWTMLARFLG